MLPRVETPNTTPKSLISIQPEQHPEQKDQKIIAKPKFKYLWMNDAKFATLRDELKLPGKYKEISKEEAEKLIAQNKRTFNLEYVMDFGANCTNALFPVWLIKTGSSGALLCVSILGNIPQDVLEKNALLNKFSYVLVMFNSLLAGLQWILMYSPWTESIKHTLKEAAKSGGQVAELSFEFFKNEILSLLEELKQAVNEVRQNPKEGGIKLVKFLLFQLVTKLINFTSGSTELFFAPTGFTWILAILLLAFAARYCSQIWDNSIADGIEFWRNLQNQSPLYEQIKEGNFGAIYRMITEAFGAIVLKGLNYKFIAEGNQKLIGFWAPPGLLMLCGILHGLFLNYPVAFKNIMLPFEQLEKALNEKIGERIDDFVETQIQALSLLPEEKKESYLKELAGQVKAELMVIDLSTPEYKQLPKAFNEKLDKVLKQLARLTPLDKAGKLAIQKQIKNLNIEVIEQKIAKEQGCSGLIANNPLNIFTLVINVMFGGYAGYRAASALPIACMPVTSCFGAGLFGGMNYSSTKTVESKKAVAAVIKPELVQQQAATGEYKKTAACIAVNGALASGLSMMGTAGSAVKDSAAAVTTVFYAVLMKVINDASFSKPAVSSTLSDLLESFNCLTPKMEAPAKDLKAEPKTPDTPTEVHFWSQPVAKVRELTKTLSFDKIRLWGHVDTQRSSFDNGANNNPGPTFEVKR